MTHNFDRTKKDFAGREMSDLCWNGRHKFCSKCECDCHVKTPQTRRVKPVTLPLPDVGTIDV